MFDTARASMGATEAADYIAKFTPRGGLVVNRPAGSGTTCLAALKTGRRYLALERTDRAPAKDEHV